MTQTPSYTEARFAKNTQGMWHFKFSADAKIWHYTMPIWTTKQHALFAWNALTFNGIMPELDAPRNAALRAREARAIEKEVTFAIAHMPPKTPYEVVIHRYDNLAHRKDLRQGHKDGIANILMWLRTTHSRWGTQERVQAALARESATCMLETDEEIRLATSDMLAVYTEYLVYTMPFELLLQPLTT